VSTAQVALAWLLARPGGTAPIVGATKLGHLRDAVASVALTLTEEEMRTLEEPSVPHAIAGHS
jgi:aryl-alcohol dehydrogenase-like predicted oxidoreductase